MILIPDWPFILVALHAHSIVPLSSILFKVNKTNAAPVKANTFKNRLLVLIGRSLAFIKTTQFVAKEGVRTTGESWGRYPGCGCLNIAVQTGRRLVWQATRSRARRTSSSIRGEYLEGRDSNNVRSTFCLQWVSHCLVSLHVFWFRSESPQCHSQWSFLTKNPSGGSTLDSEEWHLWMLFARLIWSALVIHFNPNKVVCVRIDFLLMV